MDTQRSTQAKTGRGAVVTEIADARRRRRMAELIRYAGTRPEMVTVEEFRAQRWRRERSAAEALGESLDPD